MAHKLIPGRYSAFQKKTGLAGRHDWAEKKSFKLHHKIAIGFLVAVLFVPSPRSSARVVTPSNLFSGSMIRLKGKHHRAPLLRASLADWKTAQISLAEPSSRGGVAFRYDSFVLPIEADGGFRISSKFGQRVHPLLHSERFHKGMDLARPRGSSVFPARSGVVQYAGWMGGYGRVVEIRHSDGEVTIYGHLGKLLVKTGDRVIRGETLLGTVGSSGMCTGPHLHFEVRDALGRPVDPTLKIGTF